MLVLPTEAVEEDQADSGVMEVGSSDVDDSMNGGAAEAGLFDYYDGFEWEEPGLNDLHLAAGGSFTAGAVGHITPCGCVGVLCWPLCCA